MSHTEIPNDVCVFVRSHIPSVGHMEALVLIVEEPHSAWTSASVARRLFVLEARADTILHELSTAGLIGLAASGAWRIAPHSPTLNELARRTVGLYRRHLKAMTRIIWSSRDPCGPHPDRHPNRKG